VSLQQRDALDRLLRDAPLDLGGDVAEQRLIFEEMMAAIPVAADVTTPSGTLGGIPLVNVEVAGADPEQIIFYVHGGAYAIGTAASSVGLASDLARRAGMRLVTVDYRWRASTRSPPRSRTSSLPTADCSTAACPLSRSLSLASPPALG
jgi:acetyl esterase/lipase